MNEQQYISDIAMNYLNIDDEYYRWKKKEGITKYRESFQINGDGEGKLLELGCSVGVTTKEWAQLVGEVTCVEGAGNHIKQKKRM
jgi:hypothetical protein